MFVTRRRNKLAGRVIQRLDDGRWEVRREEGAMPALSRHERRSDALARATTVLGQAGGGKWMILDDSGDVIDQGVVDSMEPRHC